MDFSQPRPRINASMLASHQGQGVCLLGMAHTVDRSGRSFQLTTSDRQNITVNMVDPLDELVNDLVEVHGVVQNNEINCHSYVLFSPETQQNFDMADYDRAVQLMQQLPQHYLQGVNPA